MFYVIPHDAVKNIINSQRDEIYKTIKQAYLLHESGETVCPSSYFLRYPYKPDQRIIALPSHIDAHINRSGIKWIGSNPNNVKAGKPRASAVFILNDGISKYPLACIESSIISATRTAYSAVLAAHTINQSHHAKSIGFVGSGPIAESILTAFSNLNWTFEQINVFDLNKSRETTFKLKAYKKFPNTAHIHSLETNELIDQSEIICFATTALTPHINHPLLACGNKTILHISLRDIAPETIINANNIVDDYQHILQAKTSLDLASSIQSPESFINSTLGAMISMQVKLDPTKSTIFSPMGLGILDLALANFVYEAALANQSAIPIPNFFGGESTITEEATQ